MDSLLAHTVFNLMFVSFVESKLGSREAVVMYYGMGVVGNVFSVLMTDRPCISSKLFELCRCGIPGDVLDELEIGV